MQTKRSDEITNLAAALAVAQGQIKTAAKDAKADTGKFNYSYATLDAIWEVARKPLSDNGLSVVQIPTNDAETFRLETILLHASGEWISGIMSLPVNAGRMSELQAMGSAITYARRYMLGSMVGITTGDDDDGRKAAQSPPNRENKPTMTPALLLKRLNREDAVTGFYDKPESIKEAIFTEGRNWPAPDDIDAWKVLFNDAIAYAFSQEDNEELEAEYPEIFPTEETE